MSMRLQIIKTGVARPVAASWYSRCGLTAWNDYSMGRHDGELYICLRGFRVGGFDSPGKSTEKWVPFSVFVPILDLWPRDRAQAWSSAMLKGLVPPNHNNQARFVAVLRAEKLLLECVGVPANPLMPKCARAGYASVRNRGTTIAGYVQRMLKRRPRREIFVDVPDDMIWTPRGK